MNSPAVTALNDALERIKGVWEKDGIEPKDLDRSFELARIVILVTTARDGLTQTERDLRESIAHQSRVELLTDLRGRDPEAHAGLVASFAVSTDTPRPVAAGE